MKKLLCTLLVAFTAVTFCAAGYKIEEIIGYVVDINENLLYVTGDSLHEGGMESALVCIASSPVYDLRTGLLSTTEAISKDMDIRVAFNARPQEPHPAVVIWKNWSYRDAAAFSVVVSENIVRDEFATAFLCTDGKYRVFIDEKTVLYNHLGEPLTMGQITAGMEFFIWAETLTASSPAMVHPDKLVALPKINN